MICQLCLKNKPLIKKSHIISDFLYSQIRDYDNSMLSLDKGNNKSPKTVYTGEFEGGLFCNDCDNGILGRYESYASKIIKSQKVVKGIKTTIVEDKYAYIEGLDYNKFKLFLLSILWRSSISNRDFFKEIKLEKEDEEKIRQMLLNGDPGDMNYLPCVISMARNQKILWGLIRQPLKTDDGYQFMFSGVFYYFFTKKETKDFVKKFSLKKDGSMNLIFLKDEWVEKIEKQLVDHFSKNPCF